MDYIKLFEQQKYKAKILQGTFEEKDNLTIENLITISGHPTFRVNDSNNNPILAHSIYDPFKEANIQAEKLSYDENSLIFVFGLGMGYHLFEIQKRIKGNSQVIVIEKEHSIIKNAMDNADLLRLFNDSRFTFIFNTDDDKLITQINFLLGISGYLLVSSKLQFSRLWIFEKMYPGLYTKLAKIILDLISNAWHGLGNDVYDTCIGLVQNFANLDVGISNVNLYDLREMYKDKPAIIVSAGPSLDKNIRLLKDCYDKCFIIAEDVTLKILLSHGIKPQVVTAIERIDVYEEYFKDKEIPKDVPLAVPLLIQPQVFEKCKDNKKIVVLRQNDSVNEWVNEILGEKLMYNIGSSVAHIATAIALGVGTNPIVYIGQDLAFGSSGKSHSADVVGITREDINNGFEGRDDIVYVEDYNGKPIPSTVLWRNFMSWFVQQIPQYPSVKFIDATEGGAYVRGTEIRTLQQVKDEYFKDTVPFIDSIMPNKNDINKEEVFKKARTELKRKQEDFKELGDKCVEIIKEINNIEKGFFNNFDKKKLDKVAEILQLTEDLSLKTMKNRLFAMFFQGNIFASIYSVNKLGLKITKEVISENLEIQKEFLNLVSLHSFNISNMLENMHKYYDEAISNNTYELNKQEFCKTSLQIITGN